jgi:hypothetical protein
VPQASDDVLRETDVLRLLIRTTAYVESILEQALETVLPTLEGRSWARSLALSRKIEFVIATGMLPQETRRGLVALNELRNEYAHQHNPPPLTVERADRLMEAWRPIFPEIAEPASDASSSEEASTEEQDLIRNIIVTLMTPAPEVIKLRTACRASVVVARFALVGAERM